VRDEGRGALAPGALETEDEEALLPQAHDHPAAVATVPVPEGVPARARAHGQRQLVHKRPVKVNQDFDGGPNLEYTHLDVRDGSEPFWRGSSQGGQPKP